MAQARILASDTNLGCRQLIENNPELVHVHETANTRFITDLDTVEDVERLAQRTGWRLELPELEAIHRQAVAEGRAEPDLVEREWRSFRSLPRNEAKWLRPRAGRGVVEGAR